MNLIWRFKIRIILKKCPIEQYTLLYYSILFYRIIFRISRVTVEFTVAQLVERDIN